MAYRQRGHGNGWIDTWNTALDKLIEINFITKLRELCFSILIRMSRAFCARCASGFTARITFIYAKAALPPFHSVNHPSSRCSVRLSYLKSLLKSAHQQNQATSLIITSFNKASFHINFTSSSCSLGFVCVFFRSMWIFVAVIMIMIFPVGCVSSGELWLRSADSGFNIVINLTAINFSIVHNIKWW